MLASYLDKAMELAVYEIIEDDRTSPAGPVNPGHWGHRPQPDRAAGLASRMARLVPVSWNTLVRRLRELMFISRWLVVRGSR